MNTLLLEDCDFISEDQVLIKGRRLKHLRTVLSAKVGDEIRIGKVNGLLGHGQITALSFEAATLTVLLNTPSPQPSSVSLICALPRPKALRRMIRSCTELGIKQITLINSYRVEKSYWQSPLLKPSELRQFCIEGLEQGCDTVLPKITLEKRFKPFVEDHLQQLVADKLAVLAHPSNNKQQTAPSETLDTPYETLLAIGPEGGFIDYEVEKFLDVGFKTLVLGERILRCETALPYAVSILENTGAELSKKLSPNV